MIILIIMFLDSNIIIILVFACLAKYFVPLHASPAGPHLALSFSVASLIRTLPFAVTFISHCSHRELGFVLTFLVAL